MINIRTEKAIKKILAVEKRDDGSQWSAERIGNSIEVRIFDATEGSEVRAKITLAALIKKRGPKRKKKATK